VEKVNTFLKIFATFVFALGLFANVANAQPNNRNDRSVFYEYGESFYSEAHPGASVAKDSAKIFVYFKILYDVMSFTASPASERAEGSFKTAPVVNVECRDEMGVIRQRAEWRRTVFAESFDETNSKTKYAYGAFELNVPAGKFTVSLDVNDQSGAVIKKIKLPPVNAQSFLKTTTATDIQFGFPAASTGTRNFRPFSLGGNIPFSSGGFRALAGLSSIDENDVYTYVVTQLQLTESPNIWGKTADIVGQTRPMTGDILKLSQNSTVEKTELDIIPAGSDLQSGAPTGNSPEVTPSTRKAIGLIDVTIPGESLVPGKYKMQVYRQGSRDTVTQVFDVIWDNMPLSLRNSKYAAEAMYYILTDTEYEQLLKGSDQDVRSKIFAYWRGKDPSPQTAFNEALAEYFKRVDYAFFNFQTLEERDGVKTERGKVYILHGMPTSINRSYEPQKPVTERWRYENKVKKEFVFEAIAEGRFKLKEIVELSQK
jgi:GWxTD domain-containing protein